MSQPCLPIPRKRGRHNEDQAAEDVFDNIESMDGAEYLSRVVKQAKKLPDIFVAPEEESVDEESSGKVAQNFIAIDGSAASLSYLISGRASLTSVPSKQHLPENQKWIEATIKNFEKLRSYLENCKAEGIGGKKTDRILFPQMKDRSGWHLFCVGKDEAQGNVGSYYGDDGDEEDSKDAVEDLPEWRKNGIPPDGNKPSVTILCQMDQVLVRRVLAHLSYYIREGWSLLTPQRTEWLYALLARLEKPIHRDDAAILFGLLKVLTLFRSKLKATDRNTLARLNTLIILIGIFFEQGGGVSRLMTFEEK